MLMDFLSEKYMKRLENALMEEKVPEFPGWKDLFRRETDFDTSDYLNKRIKNWGKRKVRKAINKYMPGSDYLLVVKDTVKRYLSGAGDEDFGLQGYETSLDDPDLKGNLAVHYKNIYKIPKVSEISNVLRKSTGNLYGYVASKFGSEYDMSRNIQDYIRLHEIVESVYMKEKGLSKLSDDEHGKMEAYLQESLKSLGWQHPDAWGIYNGCLVLNGLRDENDPFRRATEKYNNF